MFYALFEERNFATFCAWSGFCQNRVNAGRIVPELQEQGLGLIRTKCLSPLVFLEVTFPFSINLEAFFKGRAYESPLQRSPRRLPWAFIFVLLNVLIFAKAILPYIWLVAIS